MSTTTRTPAEETAAKRRAIIKLAKTEHELDMACFREGSAPRPIISETCRLNAALYDAGLPHLTPAEIDEFNVDSREPETRTGVAPPPPPLDRKAAILAARRGYSAERSRVGRGLLCAELAWINTALEDRGLSRLTAAEADALEVRAEL